MSKKKTKEKYYKIIEAATAVFARKGYYQTKVSEIAREANIADGTIYLYFKNKDDILISLFDEKMSLVLNDMVARLSECHDPIKKLECFALTHLNLIHENKGMAEIIQVEVRQSSKFMKKYRKEKFKAYLNLIEGIIREGQEKGIFKKEIIPEIAKRAFIGALDEMSRFSVLSSAKRYDIQSVTEQFRQYFLYGIVNPPASVEKQAVGDRWSH